VAAPEHIRTLSIIKEGLDLNVGTYAQWIVHEYLTAGALSTHIEAFEQNTGCGVTR